MLRRVLQKSRGAITRILEAAAAGDPEATERLMPLVYDELRGLARIRMRQGAPGQSLQPTELVHEACLRIMGSNAQAFATRRPVTLRYFAGLSLEETAEVLGISVPTITRRWAYVRAWLRRELEGETP